MDNHGLDAQAGLDAQQDNPASRSQRKPREGWEEALRVMAERGEDKLLEADSIPPTQWETEEWEWETD
jgi:hypothetical protein